MALPEWIDSSLFTKTFFSSQDLDQTRKCDLYDLGSLADVTVALGLHQSLFSCLSELNKQFIYFVLIIHERVYKYE